MKHRHIADSADDSVEAVEDILDRGTVDDRRELAGRVAKDPVGPVAQALETVLDNVHMYGTTVI